MKPSERIRELYEKIKCVDDNKIEDVHRCIKATLNYLDEQYEQQKPKKQYQCKNIVHLNVPCEDCKRLPQV